LIGGPGGSLSLVPLEMNGQQGLNLAFGFEGMEIRPGRYKKSLQRHNAQSPVPHEPGFLHLGYCRSAVWTIVRRLTKPLLNCAKRNRSSLPKRRDTETMVGRPAGAHVANVGYGLQSDMRSERRQRGPTSP
jgi:hypothetical protein